MSKVTFLIIFVISLIIGWQLLRVGYYPMHDDLQVMRLYEMDRCFKDGQIPCRMVPDMGDNYGQPMFNYYSAFPYYLGEFVHLFGVSFVDTVKLLFLASLVVSGLFAYLLAKQFLSPSAALIASVAYLVAPYHSLDIFVRGAMSESWGLALTPAVAYFLIKYIRDQKLISGLGLSLSVGALFSTHNITTLISAPFLLGIMLISLFNSRPKLISVIKLLGFGLLGVGLAAFFIFPVLVEKGLIQTQFFTADYYQYEAHFVTLKQLFLKDIWGFGPSKFGDDDDLSFYVGFWQILALIVSIPVLIKFLQKKDKKNFLWLAFWFIFSWGYLFLTHNKSTFIWKDLPLLSIVQFPWRFLGPVALGSSILLGYCFDFLPKIKKLDIFPALALLTLLIVVNFKHFTFEKYFPWIDDQQKLSGELYQLQIRAALLDYLPVTVKEIPRDPAPSGPIILSGVVNTNYFDHRSNYFASEFDVYSDEATVQMPVVYFPGWIVYQNRDPRPISYSIDNKYSVFEIKLTKGHQLIQAFFEDTPIRRISNLLTIAAFMTLTLIFLKSRSHEKNH